MKLDEYITIVLRYKKAWETHDIDLLETIFSHDVTYSEKPDNILNNINELKAYWRENIQKQSGVIFKPIRHACYNNEYITEWETTFYHLKKKKNITLFGVFFCKFRENLICDFREYFFLYENK